MRPGLTVAAILGALALAACSGADTSTPVPEVGEPFDGGSAADFFRSNCSSCHGQDRQGGIGPALRADALTRDDAFYFDAIARGRSGTAMPAWRRAGVTDTEINALIDFLRSAP